MYMYIRACTKRNSLGLVKVSSLREIGRCLTRIDRVSCLKKREKLERKGGRTTRFHEATRRKVDPVWRIRESSLVREGKGEEEGKGTTERIENRRRGGGGLGNKRDGKRRGIAHLITNSIKMNAS